MQHIKRKELDFVKVIVPPSPIFEGFTTQADALLTRSLHLRSATQELQKIRDALLPRLVSGKFPVATLDIRFPASMRVG
jgi:type I restriction enzyme S subunit